MKKSLAFEIHAAGLSDVGRKRSNNEDAFWIHPAGLIFAVADGMGGAAAGEVASRYFVDAVRQVSHKPEFGSGAEVSNQIQEIFYTANHGITRHVSRFPDCQGMGCTGEILIIHETGYVIGHVGDSRIYLQRGQRLQQLTRDHSWLQQQIDDGLLTPDEARGHRLSHLITRAVGTSDTVAVDLIQGRALAGDRFVLCTDGLTDMLTDQAIARILARDATLEAKAEQLVEAANTNGGRDNITVVLVELRDREGSDQ